MIFLPFVSIIASSLNSPRILTTFSLTVYKRPARPLRLILISTEQVLRELKTARLLFAIGKANVTSTFERALNRSGVVVEAS
ncbi:hypothetical protein LZZ85_18300 [Terrimonas sp. NA20]|uniref:Uncharacterized protein n=1 Tax=Terrimonas ginsenosidimutans TaxID=2908004 RepID=A0ABS9KVA4_9BACT|nr:hypothetical protein [Terrimonas ginsenosidimutans]